MATNPSHSEPAPLGAPPGAAPQSENVSRAGERSSTGPFGGPLDRLFSHLEGLKLPPPTAGLIADGKQHLAELRAHLRDTDSILGDLRVENEGLRHAAESAKRKPGESGD